ncbi:AT-rich interactive domain-containing protein 2-like [Silene latifolia]|uniref:AT-rich interactive domain-containing protein 2-like n=1 Tax=Silene latifolia TaxID=37657 RepID=UPI003D77E222
MQKPKKRTSPKKKVDWLEYLNDCLPALVIPIGSRFQVDIPECKGPSYDSDTARRLGTIIWPRRYNNGPMEERKIGNGRPDSCTCSSPGSEQCVKLHISEARKKLQSELGSAWKTWKFDEIGEDAGKLWTSKDKLKFDKLVKTNPLSEGKSFLKPAEEAFPYKTRKGIVSYYLNVYVPKRISMLTRSGCKTLDSDDDEIQETSTTTKNSNSLKRVRPNHVDITELVKSHYLTGRR